MPLPPEVEQQTLAEAEAAAAARSPMVAREKFGAVMASEQFDSPPASERHRALFGAGWTALQLQKAQEAQADFLRSSVMAGSILSPIVLIDVRADKRFVAVIERSEALRSPQEYTGSSEFTPPCPEKWATNQRAFRARADVQQAIAKIGRIERYELPQQ